jgi:hypothetical protein
MPLGGEIGCRVVFGDNEPFGSRQTKEVNAPHRKVASGTVLGKDEPHDFRMSVTGCGDQVDDFADQPIVLPVKPFPENI